MEFPKQEMLVSALACRCGTSSGGVKVGEGACLDRIMVPQQQSVTVSVPQHTPIQYTHPKTILQYIHMALNVQPKQEDLVFNTSNAGGGFEATPQPLKYAIRETHVCYCYCVS